MLSDAIICENVFLKLSWGHAPRKLIVLFRIQKLIIQIATVKVKFNIEA